MFVVVVFCLLQNLVGAFAVSFAARLQDVEPEVFIGFVFFELVRCF